MYFYLNVYKVDKKYGFMFICDQNYFLFEVWYVCYLLKGNYFYFFCFLNSVFFFLE